MSLDYDWMFDDFWHKISALLGLNMHNVIVLVISILQLERRSIF
jgi:hypothetical protein